MTEIVCPSCEHVFEVDDYDSGDCPSCGKMHYYWDDDWNYESNNSQQRFVWYKDQLMEVFKNKDIYPDWYKEYLKDLRGFESFWLKSLQDESYWLNQGIDYIASDFFERMMNK